MNTGKQQNAASGWLQRSEVVIYIVVLLLAGLSLAGWLLRARPMLAPLNDAIPINPLTAIVFALLSAAIILWRLSLLPAKAFTITVVTLLVLNVYVLLDKVFYFPLHVDLLFFLDEMKGYEGHEVLKGMATTTCFCFIVSLAAVWMIKVGRVWSPFREWLNVLVFFLSLTVLVCYLFRVPELAPIFLMAPLTAVLFLLLSAALLLVEAEQGLLRNFFTGYFSVSPLRLLIPLSILFPIALGYLRLLSEGQQILSKEMGVAIIIVVFTVVLTGATAFIARITNRRGKLAADYQDQASNLAAANEELRSLTEELQATNEELSASNEALISSNRALEEANATIAKQKDEQLNRVLDSANDVICAFDLTGQGDSYLSRSAERVYRRPYEVLLQTPFFWNDFVHPDDRIQVEQTQQQLDKTGECASTLRILVNDEQRWIRNQLRLVRNKSGAAVRLEAVLSDVTAMHQKELEVVRERNLLRALIDHIPSYIFLRDTNLKTILGNRASYMLLGANNENDILGRNLIDYYGESARELYEEEKGMIDTGLPMMNRETNVVVQGKEVLLSVTKIPLKDENGKVIQILGISHDITELRKREKELEQYKAELELVFNNSSDIFFLLDREFKLVLFNQRFSELVNMILGRTPISGTSVFEWIKPERLEVARNYYQQAFAGNASEITSTIAVHGIDRTFRTNYRPVFANGTVDYVAVFSVEITETVQLENTIDVLFKTTRDTFLLISDERKIIRFNKAYEDFAKDVLGIELKVGDDFVASVPPSRKAIVNELLTKALAGERSVVDAEFVQKNGKKVFHHLRYEPITSNGRVLYVSISGVDVTEFKEIEANLRRGQYFLDQASESARVGYWTSELIPNGKLTWSKEVFRIFGVQPENFSGTNQEFFDRVHPDDREEVWARAKDARERGSVYDIDHRIILPDGSVRWVNEKAQIRMDEATQSTLMVGIVQDINERKLVEATLREYNERFEILSNATNDAIWDWDLTNDHIHWNHGVNRIFGYKEQEVGLRARWEEKVHEQDLARVRKEIASTFKNQETHWSSEYRFHSNDGTFRYVLDRAFVIYRDDRAVRMIGAMQDVTEVTEYRLNLERIVKERTQKLNEALAKEKELVDIKSKFISIVSHEFRTPLATITLAYGFLKRYKDKLTSELLENKLGVIEKQVHHMTALLEDVLFVGKVEGGKLTANLKIHSPSLFQEFALEAMNATSKSNHVLDYWTTGTPHEFVSDEKLLRNIILNLVSNAVKFSPHAPTVVMTVDFSDEAILLSVRDQGIGIPNGELKNLFTSFSRATNASGIEGTGLGLVILKKATELLGGTVEVWSELGKGTEFKITLPNLN